MKRKNLIAKRKVKELYKKFEKIVLRNIKKANFAVAVSGGADSLCLSYFSKLYSKKFKNKIYFLIINHNIRKESYPEALKVKKILHKKNISCSIINMHTIKPFDNDLFLDCLSKVKAVITVEEHSENGGLGEKCASIISQSNIKINCEKKEKKKIINKIINLYEKL